jgi:hypothetical protein
MAGMKKQGTGRRVLHFAVSGALLGGVGIGCAAKNGPRTNEGPQELHVNPGPDETPEPEETVNTAPVDEPAPDGQPDAVVNTQPEPEPEPPNVNPGRQ